MKDIELTANEIYFLAYQMQKIWQENDKNRYAESIFNKTKVLLDDVIEENNFKREYESEWVSNETKNNC